MKGVLRIIVSVIFGYILFAAIAISLDRVSSASPIDSSLKNLVENLLALFAPITFGLLILISMMVGVYFSLPKALIYFRR